MRDVASRKKKNERCSEISLQRNRFCPALLHYAKTRSGLQKYKMYFANVQAAHHSSESCPFVLHPTAPAARSRTISSPTTLLFSSDRRRKGCLTGLASGRTCNLCSAKSVGTPGMSLGDHAKMSRFSWRKSTSSPSYLLPRFAPMTACLSGCSGSKGIFFVSLAG